MGRHSAPDEEDAGGAGATVVERPAPDRPARHYRPDTSDAGPDTGSDTAALTLRGRVTEQRFSPAGGVPARTGRRTADDPAAPAETAEAAVTQELALRDAAPTAEPVTVAEPAPSAESEPSAESAPTAVTGPPVAEAPTESIPVIGPEPQQVAGPADAERAEAEAAPSDLALLRARPMLRLQVLAAVLVPFIAYVLVMLVLNRSDVRTVLIWAWIPLVSAGVLGGLLLDRAARAARSGRAASGPSRGGGDDAE